MAEHRAESRDSARQHEGLQAHAQLELGIGDNPVYEGVAHFHYLAVRAKGAASGSLAPFRAAELELHRAGQALAGHSVELDAEALQGSEIVRAVDAARGHVGDLGQNLPHARDLEIYGFGLCGAQEACKGQGGSPKLPGKGSCRYMCAFRLCRLFHGRFLYPVLSQALCMCLSNVA